MPSSRHLVDELEALAEVLLERLGGTVHDGGARA
jgi:hypothetical protein